MIRLFLVGALSMSLGACSSNDDSASAPDAFDDGRQPLEGALEAPGEESVVGPVDQGANVPVDEPTEETSLEAPTEEPIEQPTGETVDEPIELPSEETVEEPAEQPTEETVEEPAEQPTEENVEEPAEQPTEETVEEPVEQPTEENVEEPVEQPTEEIVEEPVEQPTEENVEEPAEQPTEENVEEPTDQPTEETDDEPVEQPMDETVEESGEEPVEQPTAAGATINVENRAAVLENVLAVIGGEIYRPTYALVDDVLLGEGNSTQVSEERGPDGEFVTASECADSGRFDRVTTGGGQFVRARIDVDACRIDGIVFDGELSRDSDFSDGDDTDRTLDLVAMRSNGDVVTLSSSSVVSDTLLGRTVGFAVSRYEVSGSDGPVLVEEASSSVSREVDAGSDMERASFAARVTAPWTGGEALEIRTEVPFTLDEPSSAGRDATTFTSGTLVAEAADGSRLTIDAANGDPSSVSVVIEADGGTSAFTVPVGDELRIPCAGRQADESGEDLACSLEPGLPL